MTAKKIAECIVYSEQCDTGTVVHIGDTMTNEQIGELVRWAIPNTPSPAQPPAQSAA